MPDLPTLTNAAALGAYQKELEEVGIDPDVISTLIVQAAGHLLESGLGVRND